jgi:hypothetical protein
MANILMQSMGLEKEEDNKNNGTYCIGEQGDLGGFFEQLNEKDQKTYDRQVLNEKKDSGK